MRLLLTLLCTSVLLGVVGCFETTLSLGPERDAKVDPAFCGNWEVPNPDHPDQQKVSLVIRNIDGRKYYVEWTDPNDKSSKTLRMVGYTADVKGTIFAHLRDLPEDGTIPDKHMVMRIALKDGQLALRNLDEKFFKEKPLETDADFRRLVEENLDNSAMYDEGEIMATRANH